MELWDYGTMALWTIGLWDYGTMSFAASFYSFVSFRLHAHFVPVTFAFFLFSLLSGNKYSVCFFSHNFVLFSPVFCIRIF